MTRFHRIWEKGKEKRVPFTREEEAAWDAEEAAALEEQSKPPEPSLEDRMVDLERRLATLEKK